MSFYKPFDNLLTEVKSVFDIEHEGFVEDNNDPEKLGRIRVRIPMWEDIPTEYLPWCIPSLPYFLGNSRNTSMFSVPEIGTQVKIYFSNRDKYHPNYKGTSLSRRNKSTLFDEDYPNTYGFVDSVLNFFKVNKVKKEIKLQHSTTTNLVIDSNGDFSANHHDGSNFKLGASGLDIVTPSVNIDGVLTVSTGKSVSVPCGNVQLTFEGGILVNVQLL